VDSTPELLVQRCDVAVHGDENALSPGFQIPFYLYVIKAEIICDSIGEHEVRITSAILTYPRFIHSELMTHRAFSRNAASSRAIPVDKMLASVIANPARPVHWGKAQRGMQAYESLGLAEAEAAIKLWDKAALANIEIAKELLNLGVHKQVANRLLEPFAHMTTLVTATDFHNFFSLRADPEAQPEFQVLGFNLLTAYLDSTPKILKPGDWHIPFGDRMPEVPQEMRLKIATARAARLSYMTFDGVIDPDKDYALHDSLKESGHWSPFEHCAQCLAVPTRSGNFRGWHQYRKMFPNENREGVNLHEIAKRRVHFYWEDYQQALAA
jgi:thymidylate synthase ThyX